MSHAFLLFVIVFALLFLMRMPVPLSMICSCIVYCMYTGMNVQMIAQKSLASLYGNYALFAVPLFIFAANIMNEGKVTDYVFGFAKGFVGHLPGGLAHVNVLASLIFSGMTGSAIADAAGLGKMEIAAMKNEGYDDGFSCAITAASATIGPIFPPSIPMVIYSMLSSASVGALFLGGMVPGILLAAFLMIYVAFVSHKRNYPRDERVKLNAFLKYTAKALPAIFTPVILLFGIYAGVVTATEAGAIAGLYALLISVLYYRSMGGKAFLQLIKTTIKDTGTTALMVGAAAPMSYIVARERIADSLSAFILGFTDNRYVLLLLVNILFLVLGCLIDTNVLQLVFIPLILPVVQAFNIDLVHFGILLTFNMMIGLSTPPFGMLLFITSGISGTPLKKVVKEIWWPIAVMLLVLAIVTYFPDVSLFLPRIFMGYKG